MKKLMFALALVGFTTGAMAQENEIPTQKYSVATNSFWANWFVQVGGQFNAAYTNEEQLGNKNPFSVDRGTFGFEVAVGKWFTPVIGLRTKFQGIWSKAVVDADNHHAYKYWGIQEDVMFNLSNAFCGYNEKRFWNIAPYVGIGYMQRMKSTDDANAKSLYRDPSYNVGIYNSFRINRRLAAYLDVWALAAEGSFDGVNGEGKTDWRTHEKTHCRYWDKMVGVSVGLNVNLGKTIGWNKVPDVDALMAMNKEQLDALNASLKESIESVKLLLRNSRMKTHVCVTSLLTRNLQRPRLSRNSLQLLYLYSSTSTSLRLLHAKILLTLRNSHSMLRIITRKLSLQVMQIARPVLQLSTTNFLKHVLMQLQTNSLRWVSAATTLSLSTRVV